MANRKAIIIKDVNGKEQNLKELNELLQNGWAVDSVSPMGVGMAGGITGIGGISGAGGGENYNYKFEKMECWKEKYQYYSAALVILRQDD